MSSKRFIAILNVNINYMYESVKLYKKSRTVLTSKTLQYLPQVTRTLGKISNITHMEVGLQHNNVHSTVLLYVFSLWQKN